MKARVIIKLDSPYKSHYQEDAARDSVSTIIRDSGAATGCLQVASDFKIPNQWSYLFDGIESEEAFHSAVISAIHEWGIKTALVVFQKNAGERFCRR